MVTNILDYLELTAKRFPEKTALADDKLSLTFGQWVLQAESIGTAELKFIKGNHFVANKNPSEFNDAVLKFLRQ